MKVIKITIFLCLMSLSLQESTLISAENKDTAKNSAAATFADCRLELKKILHMETDSDVYDYLDIDLAKIAENINHFFKEDAKVYFESIQVEAIPAGLIINFNNFESDLFTDNYIPIFSEIDDKVNPYDLIISYNGQQWLSSDDFLKTGANAYRDKSDANVNVKILKSSLDKVIETDYSTFEEIFDNAREGMPQYGIKIYDGFLVTRILREARQKRYITVGSFIMPIEIEQDSSPCKKQMKRLDMDTVDMLIYIEETYLENNQFYLWYNDPASLIVNSRTAHFERLYDLYVKNYTTDINLNNDDKKNINLIILRHFQSEYPDIMCQIYKWAFLSSKVSDNILHITREVK